VPVVDRLLPFIGYPCTLNTLRVINEGTAVPGKQSESET
jgi:hypothetical protein